MGKSKKTPAKKPVGPAAKKETAPASAAPPIAKLAAPGPATIQYDVKFYGGAGQIVLKGQNLNKTAVSDSSFTVNQNSGAQTVFVGGTAPAGGSGRIEVQVSESGKVLSPSSSNVFTGLFNSAITYTVA
jgi:hypothetical protein